MQNKKIKLSMLMLGILLAQKSFALETLDDQDLSQITGQDGISVQVAASKITADQFAWKDSTQVYDTTSKAFINGKLNLAVNNITMTPIGSNQITSTASFDVGQTTNGTGILMSIILTPAQLNAKSIQICSDSSGTANCSNAASSNSLGSLTIQNRSNTEFTLFTSRGLFSATDLAYLKFAIQNTNIFETLQNTVNSQPVYNQLILKDFNFNFSGNGYMYIDPTNGLVLSTNKPGQTNSGNTVSLTRVNDVDNLGKTRPGFNIDLRYKTNIGNDSSVYSASDTDTNSLSFLRFGASGQLSNAQIMVNGSNVSLGNATSSGATSSSDMAGTGIAMNMKASFAPDVFDSSGNLTTQGVRLELGGSGVNSYALEFGNLTPLQVRKNITTGSSDTSLNTDYASINFGNIYLNTVQSQTLSFQIGSTLAKILGTTTGLSTTANSSGNYQYTQNVYEGAATSPNILSMAVRGFEFQSIARSARFIADNSNDAAHQTSTATSTWGIGIPIYNLNANLGLYGTQYGYSNASDPLSFTIGSGSNQGIGFGLTASTTGVDSTGSKTTSIILIDGAKNPYQTSESVNYYAGLRNIDSFIDANGVLGFESNGIKLNLTKLLLALSAQVAFGQLPGSRYAVSGCSASTAMSCFVPSNSFTAVDDVLFGMSMRINGTGYLTMIPGKNGNMQLGGYLALTPSTTTNNSYLHISDAGNGSMLGLDNLSGNANLNANLQLTQTSFQTNTTVQINPNQTPDGVLKGTLNFYPSSTASAQKLGDMALTGGTIRSSFGITPR